jgi:predicted AlkP superfamily pyrophosphatase or phosphodiesterase
VKRLRLPLLLVLALACAPALPPAPQQPVPPPAPRFAPTGTAQRVVLVSFDGLGAEQFRAQANLPAFDRASNEGTTARIIPVNPTATGPAHVSILTGTTPDKHGIVANRFHLPGTPPEQTAIGLMTDADAETLVEAARRQGKRVGCVTFATMDAKTPRRTCDFGMAWVPSLTRGRAVTLRRSDFRREWVPPTWTPRSPRRRSFSPIMRARLEWAVPDAVRADVDVVAYDETDDNVANYDAIAIERDGSEVNIASDGWFAISKRGGDALYGSWSKLITLDNSLDGVELYWGGIHRNDAWPADFRTMIDGEIGFWPGDAQADATPEIFREQAERFGAFLTRVQTTTIRRVPFDLLLLYRNEIDHAAHEFLGENATIIRSSWESADRAFAAIRDSLDLTRDALVVTGDHGLAEVDTEVRLGRFLVDQNLAPRWRAFASGHVANFYRFGAPDDTDAIVNLLTGTGWFEKVERKSAASHRNAGDIIAIAKTNVVVTPSADGPVTIRPGYHGQHGGLNTHPELHTLFFATGAGIPRATFSEISQTKIARYVSQLLGIEPPASAE